MFSINKFLYLKKLIHSILPYPIIQMVLAKLNGSRSGSTIPNAKARQNSACLDVSIYVDLCVALGVVVTVLLIAYAGTLLWNLPYYQMDHNLVNGSTVHQGVCNVKIIEATMHNRIDLDCLPDYSQKPLHDQECNTTSGLDPKLYCDQITNRCAPYCFKRGLYRDETVYFHCYWDVRNIVMNATIQLSPANVDFYASFTYKRLLPLNSYARDAHDILWQGIETTSFCSYQIDENGTMIDGATNHISHAPFVILRWFIPLILLCACGMVITCTCNSLVRMGIIIGGFVYGNIRIIVYFTLVVTFIIMIRHFIPGIGILNDAL